jgi:hypothetical protein
MEPHYFACSGSVLAPGWILLCPSTEQQLWGDTAFPPVIPVASSPPVLSASPPWLMPFTHRHPCEHPSIKDLEPSGLDSVSCQALTAACRVGPQ